MDWMGRPLAAALEAAAPLTERAENLSVSIPATLSWSLTQRPIVELDTGLCGLFDPTNKRSLFESLLIEAV